MTIRPLTLRRILRICLDMAEKPDLKLVLCAPRGFCAGVDRAIQIVELALKKYGAPVYVRHEIVHNKYVVDRLKRLGAIFVEELDEIPQTDAPVIFSAHGVPQKVPADAKARNMFYLDATCPLVSKVHKEAQKHFANNNHVILIGHEGHPEVIGTMGQVAPGAITLVETVEDVEQLTPEDPDNLAFVTQTTLSVDDTAEIVARLEQRFPTIQGPYKEDICYATTNRQEAVKAVAPMVDAMLIVGAPNSSNSMRLVEVAQRAGCDTSMLVQRANDIDWAQYKDIKSLGLSAGASAPEDLVNEIIDAFGNHFTLDVQTQQTAIENIAFNVPRELRDVVDA